MKPNIAVSCICAVACAQAHRSVRDEWYSAYGTIPPHLDASAPVNDRVAALLALMTVPEKVAQTLIPLYPVGANYSDLIPALYNETGLGLLYNPTQGPAVGGSSCSPYDVLCNALAQNALQASIIASSRLKLPISFVAETLHGAINMGAVFPMSSALGASWDTALVQSIGSAIAREGRIGGLDRGYSPLLGVCTDARFGRTEENYGEDPALVAAMGVAFATGQHQGEVGGPSTYLPADALVTEAKHYAAYGYSGRDGMAADISDELLMDVYLRPWRDYAAAGGRGVMASHNSVQGMPNHMNARLLTGILRDLFGMQEGFVATDDSDVELLPNFHIVDNASDAAAAAILAGVDNNLANAPTSFELYMTSLVTSEQVPMAALDRAAAATLRAKFAAGLFDNFTYINTSRLSELDAPATRALARTAAQESIVLLKNVNGTLPMDFARVSKVAVLGPNAGCPAPVPNAACAVAANTAGGYTNQGVYVSTVLDAFMNASASHGFAVSYAQGAIIGVQNTSLIPAAVAAAAAADVAVVVLGHESIGYGQGDCAEGLDADDLDLDGSQGDLLYALLTQTTTPVVLVLIHGRPLTFGAGASNRWLSYNGMLGLPNLVAVLSAWRPGEEGGNALFDVISGAVNPSGRLAQGWPRHVGQVRQSTPWMQFWWENQADYAPARSIARTPLFPFGYGLSYSTFDFTSLSVTPQSISNASLAATVTVNVTVTNSAGPAGRAVVQVYFNQTKTRLSRYTSMLLGFTKVDVPAAPSSVIASITVPLLNLAAWDTPSGNYTADATTYGVWAAVHSGVQPSAGVSAFLTVTGV